MKTIKQSVINTFDRVGINYKNFDNTKKDIEVRNWLTGEPITVTPLIAYCIIWVYNTQRDYEAGRNFIKISDFDRVRYFIAEQDTEAYRTCID